MNELKEPLLIIRLKVVFGPNKRSWPTTKSKLVGLIKSAKGRLTDTNISGCAWLNKSDIIYNSYKSFLFNLAKHKLIGNKII
jgi:hypothetical protein